MKEEKLFEEIPKGTKQFKHKCQICKKECKTAKGLLIHIGKNEKCKEEMIEKW